MHYAALVNRSKTKKVTALVLIAALILLICDRILFRSYHIKTATHHTLSWMYNHDALMLVLHILSMILFTYYFVPPSLLVLTSGFIFQSIYIHSGCGLVIAWMASILGAAIGGTLAFSKSSRPSHELYEVLLDRYPILSVVDTALEKNPLRVMMLLRLNPLFPFGVLNYVFATKKVNVSLFVVATTAVAQWYLFLVCVGAGFSNMYNGYAYGGYMIGAACGALVMAIMWRFSKRELQQEVEFYQWKQEVIVVKDVEIATFTAETKKKKKSRMKRLKEKLTGSKKKTKKPNDDSETIKSADQSVLSVVEPVDSNIIKDSDLSSEEYARMQILGQDHMGGFNDAYRTRLDVAEIILDDYS